MITNKISNVRGWLPAGLVLNTLLDTTDRGDDTITCVPMLAGGRSKYPDQGTDPSWVKVTQATSSCAIQLRGKFLSPALLGALKGMNAPAPEEPCILLANVMFDGEILMLSGEELPVSRISINRLSTPELYSYYSGLTEKDVLAKHVFAGAVMPATAASIVVTDPSSVVNYIDASPIAYALPGVDPVLAYTARHSAARYMTVVGTAIAYTDLNYGDRLDVVELVPANPERTLPAGVKTAVIRPTAADTIVTINSSREVVSLPSLDWPAKPGEWAKISQDISLVGTSC